MARYVASYAEDDRYVIVMARMRVESGVYEQAKTAALEANMSVSGWLGEAVSEKLARDAEKEEA